MWAKPLDPQTRAAMVRAALGSQRLSGVEITRAQAERILLGVLHEPLVELG